MPTRIVAELRHTARVPVDGLATAAAPEGAAPELSLLRRPSVRVWSFTVALAVVASLLFLVFLAHLPAPDAPVRVPWIFMAGAFFISEFKVVDVHWRREKHSFSLSEFPAVISFFLLSPGDYMLAMLVGNTAAVLMSREPIVKVAFNIAMWGITAAAGLTVFYVAGATHGAPELPQWGGAFAGAMTAAVLQASAIAAAISMSGGAPQFEKLPEMVQFGVLVAVANTSLALLAVSALWLNPLLLLLLAVPLLTVALAYRAYGSEREKHERLELLYQSSRILQHSPALESTLAALLDHAREMFRAELAEMFLWPRNAASDGMVTTASAQGPRAVMQPVSIAAISELHQRVGLDHQAFLHWAPARSKDSVRSAMAAPLLGEAGLIGSIVISNRIGEGATFGKDDLRLLETVANQAAVALENGHLEQSLTELSRLKEELRHQAFHDPLTGLANRTLFADRVDAALAASAVNRTPVVLFMDLDNFKDVNDTLGHAAGDRLLLGVADRLRACIREDDLAARLGGDEFAVLLFDDADLANALSVATRLIDSLAVSFPVEGQDLKISASIGIAAVQGEGERADDLLRNADVAMYTAKHAGRSRFSVFEPTMHAAIVARHTLSTELSRGISEGAIGVYYQPVVELETGRIYGAEALARWMHPTRGVVGPDEFIGLAEESGAILELGRAVLFESCREAAGWRSGSDGEPVVTVNLSAAQLGQDGFVADVVDILRATGLHPSRLVLEMTETVMFHDTGTTISRLSELRELGVRVAIDDFGTGYSSLGYLRRFPVDILKIAREFVMPPDAAPDAWAFASAIVALGRSLNLSIVAEGIEDVIQLERLREMGCELGQGFLFARPMPGDEFRALLTQRVPRRRPHEAARVSPTLAVV